MGLKPQNLAALCILFVILVGVATADVAQDKAECANQLVGLATCLPYVGGQAKAPTLDCCSGLKEVVDKSKKCLCILILDKDDPSLGLQINGTLAATLPVTCHSPVNLSDCITLLHLTPSSKEAKIFEGYEKIAEEQSSTPAPVTKGNSSSNSTIAPVQSDGGLRKKMNRWFGSFGIQMVFGVSLLVFYFTI